MVGQGSQKTQGTALGPEKGGGQSAIEAIPTAQNTLFCMPIQPLWW